MKFEKEPLKNTRELIKEVFQVLLHDEYVLTVVSKFSNAYLIGTSVFRIFSNNNEVLSPDNNICNLGSLRYAGGVIADIINIHFPQKRAFHYLDFSFGPGVGFDEIDVCLKPFYEGIFTLLKNKKCDWIYNHPRIQIIDFSKGRSEEKDNLMYNPNKALTEEIRKKEEAEKLQKLREEFDRLYEDEVKSARKSPYPKLIQAYEKIYGHLPVGF